MLDPDALLSPALVLIDLQAGTLPNARAVPAHELVPRTQQLADAFRAAGRPVVVVLAIGTPRGRTEHGAGGRVFPQAFTEPVVMPADGEAALRRAAWSAFAETDLAARLDKDGVRTVVLAGIATSFGVESTARAASDLGYDVVVVGDAVSDPSPEAHDERLARVFPMLARVRGTAAVIAAVGGR